ncbi:hypothetical protein SMA90_26765, partial [Escherichia coli]
MGKQYLFQLFISQYLSITFQSKTMHRVIIVLIFFFMASGLYGQVTVTGHITAEIIEGFFVSPKMSKGFDVNKYSGDIDLGEVTLSSDDNVACIVILEPGELIHTEGDRITMTTTVAETDNKMRFSACTKNLTKH